MCAVMSGTWETFAPDAELLARAEHLARQKYSENSYNQRR
jgi:hypothetical protein